MGKDVRKEGVHTPCTFRADRSRAICLLTPIRVDILKRETCVQGTACPITGLFVFADYRR